MHVTQRKSHQLPKFESAPRFFEPGRSFFQKKKGGGDTILEKVSSASLAMFKKEVNQKNPQCSSIFGWPNNPFVCFHRWNRVQIWPRSVASLGRRIYHTIHSSLSGPRSLGSKNHTSWIPSNILQMFSRNKAWWNQTLETATFCFCLKSWKTNKKQINKNKIAKRSNTPAN